MDHSSAANFCFFRRELVFALVFIVIGSLLEKAVDRTDLIYPLHAKNQPAVFVPKLNKTDGRKSPEQVIDQLRTAVEGSLVAVEDTLERVLFAYADRFLPSSAREEEPTGPLVMRFFGPSGTGKKTMACLLATAAYSYEDATAKCIKNQANFEGPFIVSRTFKKDGSAVKEMLNVIRDVNKKLEGRERHGIALVLNDYSMADRNVWAVMSSFIKQDNMKNSIVVLTDGLVAAEGSDVSNIRLSPGTTTGEALDMIEDEVTGAYPGEYLDLSGNHTDVWIPFLPLPDEALGRLIQRVCDGENARLKRLIPDYHGKSSDYGLSSKKLTSWIGRLVCDAKSKAQASLKLSSCAQDQGANILKAFEEAFGSVLRERKFCRLPETGEIGNDSDLWTKCLSWKGLPMVSIAFEVDTALQQPSESCSAADIREWIQFRLFNSLPGPSDNEFADGPMCLRTFGDQPGLVFSHAGPC